MASNHTQLQYCSVAVQTKQSMLYILHSWIIWETYIDFKVVHLTYKSLNGTTSDYLVDHLISYSSIHLRLSSDDQHLLVVPKSNPKTFGDRRPHRAWHVLHLELRCAISNWWWEGVHVMMDLNIWGSAWANGGHTSPWSWHIIECALIRNTPYVTIATL